jgi:adenosylcobinamide kinase/adenosylcobinamide-phosphate guanylyltransferase
VVVDCLTVWLGNLMHHQDPIVDGIPERLTGLLTLLDDPPMDIILVTNEVGMGIIPGDGLSRAYRDLAGIMNQRVAAVASDVVLVACGLPLILKPCKIPR